MAQIADDFSVIPIAASTTTAMIVVRLGVKWMGIPADDTGVVLSIIVGIGLIISIVIGIFFRRSEYMAVWISAGLLLFALFVLLISSLVWLVAHFI